MRCLSNYAEGEQCEQNYALTWSVILGSLDVMSLLVQEMCLCVNFQPSTIARVARRPSRTTRVTSPEPKPSTEPPCAKIVSRADWKARNSDMTCPAIYHPIPRVVIHHTATPPCFDFESCSETVREIQTDHMDYQGNQILYYSSIQRQWPLYFNGVQFTFDTVGWATGRAFGLLKKTGCWFVGGDGLTGALQEVVVTTGLLKL